MSKVFRIHAALANPLGSPQPTGPGEKAVAKGVRIGADRNGAEDTGDDEDPVVAKGVRIGADRNMRTLRRSRGRKGRENWSGSEHADLPGRQAQPARSQRA